MTSCNNAHTYHHHSHAQCATWTTASFIARDVTHQLWCINNIPANSPGYPRILPDKEVKSLGTLDCRKFSCCRLVDLPVQPTCVITTYSKDCSPRRKLLTNFTVHSERSRENAAFLHCLLLSHRRGVVYTAHHACACVALRACTIV